MIGHPGALGSPGETRPGALQHPIPASRFLLVRVVAAGIQSIFIGSATASAVAAINMQIVAMLMDAAVPDSGKING